MRLDHIRHKAEAQFSRERDQRLHRDERLVALDQRREKEGGGQGRGIRERAEADEGKRELQLGTTAGIPRPAN